MTEEQILEKEKIFPDIEDININSMAIPDAELDKLSEIDKAFIKVNQSVALARTINAIETKIVLTCKAFREYFPDADIETIKIIGSRIDDIKDEEVDTLTMGFIESLITVEGKRYEIQTPALVEKRFGAELKKLSKIDYYRALIGVIKGTSNEIDISAKRKDEFKKIFDEKVDDKYKEIIASPDKLEKFTTEYYNAKINDPNTSDEMKEKLQKTLVWTEYAYTLQPIIDSVRKILQDKRSTSSIVYGYNNQAAGIFKTAVKNCQTNNITFPLKALTGIEVVLLGDKYKKHQHLFTYLAAWYIRHLGVNIDPYQKIFITQLISLITQVSQHKDAKENDPTAEIKEKMRGGVKNLLDLVIDNCK